MQRLLLWIARFAVNVYYRPARLGGVVPATGPVLLVGNHPNGLVDPVLLAAACKRPVRFLGKAPLFEMPVLGAVMRGLEALPVYRSQDDADTSLNERTFQAVFEALERGEVVCLFPEGRSHDEPTLQRLKTGVARMALGAGARSGFRLDVRVVPVGLVYRAKRRFRSQVAAWIGKPIGVRDLATVHEQSEREAVRVLTDRIAAGLAAVLLELDRWEDLPLLELAAQIVPRPGSALERQQVLARGLRYLRSRQRERIEALSDRIQAFRKRLRELGLAPEHLDVRYRPARVLRYAAKRAVQLVLGLPLALLGMLFWAPPYWLVPWIPRWLGATRDVHATIQILAGLVLFPLWALSVALGAWSALGPWIALLVFLAAFPLFLAALWFRDWRAETASDVIAFLRLARRTALRESLLHERAAIAAEIAAIESELALR